MSLIRENSIAVDQDKFADYELRLMDLDSEHLSIPDTDYSCTISQYVLQSSTTFTSSWFKSLGRHAIKYVHR